MIAARQERIAAAFARAMDYDRHATVQRLSANRLAADIARLGLSPSPRLLEIGCGTGFLTEALSRHIAQGDWLVTDIAPAMLARCKQRLGIRPHIRYVPLDGQYPALTGEGPFDLICSNLALQWIDDLEGALTRLLSYLAPGGHCIFTTLAEGTFAEWRDAHRAQGLVPGTPSYPSPDALGAMRPRGLAGECRIDRYEEHHPSAMGFLRALKAIGADTAAPDHRPLHAGGMRRVLRAFEDDGATVSYVIATCHYRKGIPT